MAKRENPFTKGKWIVHTYYGVGQIKGIENKQIEDEKIKYLKVEAKDSVFFVPSNNIDMDRIRPIASQYKIRKAINIMKEPAQAFEDDHNIRKRQLSEKLTDNSIENMARLIRDLYNRRVTNGLNDHEERSLEKLTDRIVLEWALAKDIDVEEARGKLEDTLNINLFI